MCGATHWKRLGFFCRPKYDETLPFLAGPPVEESTVSTAPERSTIRRPRMTPERERELLLAALEILRNRGYDALTMEAVATEARCSKATLYRLFGSKQKLVAAAMYATRPVADEI